MLKGIIFDLDGTLVDSDPYWKEADELFAKEYPFLLTDKFREQLSGLGIRESAELFIKTYNLPETIDSFMAKRMKYLYKILLQKLKLMPFAKELLETLKINGYTLALATAGHGQQIAKEILEKLLIIDYFSYVISGLEVKNSKPAPDVYLFVANKIGLHPDECIVIEDTVNRVISGKRAGMKAIGVNSNDQIRERLKNAGAEVVYKDLNIPVKVFRKIG